MAVSLATVELFATPCNADANASGLHVMGGRCRGTVFATSSVGRRSLCVACLPSSTSQEGLPPPSPPPKPLSTKKLYVGSLSFITTEDRLRTCFSRFGQLVEVKIMMDRVAKRSKGFGFIEYATEEAAAEAIKGMDGKFLDGRVIFVEFAKPKTQNHGSPPPKATGPTPFL